jgi:hypothetical protein
MIIDIFYILALLQLKHWYIDFVNQSNQEVISKGHYGELAGIRHSLKHGILTGCIFYVINPFAGLVIGIIDFITHYHIDWIKRNFGNQDIQNPKFWNHFGLDQMMHQLCYLVYVFCYLKYTTVG